jgi:hypothetical protein
MTNQSWRQMLSLHRDKRLPCMHCMSTNGNNPESLKKSARDRFGSNYDGEKGHQVPTLRFVWVTSVDNYGSEESAVRL